MIRATLLLAALLLAAPAAQAVVIDAFSDNYPPNPDLPLSMTPTIFVGSRCDGGSCPPNPIVNHLVDDVADQSGLAGVLGGNRKATVTYVTGSANSVIAPTANALTFNHNASASAILDLEYGETVDLDADLTVGAATQIQFDVSGDMFSGPRPVPCTVTVTSARGTGAEATFAVTQDLVLDGTYAYPFASFPGVDFTDVDRVHIRFDASAVSSVDFAVFTIGTDEQPTPVESSTWGRLKTLYDR